VQQDPTSSPSELMSPELMFPGEVADLFRVEVKTVARWDKAGKFPKGTVIKTLGGERRYRRSAILSMLDFR
jgi:DNA-binding transcriptional MerR regulator